LRGDLREPALVLAQCHSTRDVDMLMTAEGFASSGHDIGGSFTVGPINVT